MNNKLILIFIFTAAILSKENRSNYLWPTNTSETITATYGDERSRRFHAGIDIRTFGYIGKELYAIESGYISRIVISPNGYGKALYLKLNDGNTVLYAHLDEFHPYIQEKVRFIQKETDNSFVDYYLKKNELKFTKGDIIGYTGDSGSISGPHLHFEIRDQNGDPLNPLTKYFSIPDTLNPIAYSIAFIPLDNSCWINGVQDYYIKNLSKNNEYKYVLRDTVSIVGNFGIAINVRDKINTIPWNLGIYQIELLIDNRLIYKLDFDKYSFDNDPLIYREIDFHLLNKFSQKYHRLFVNNNSELNFIESLSAYGTTLDKNYHNLVINVSDNNNNKIQIQGILKGDVALHPQLEFDKDTRQLFSKNGFDNIQLNFTTRYEDSQIIPASYIGIDSLKILVNMPKEPYDILEYFSKDINGLKSKIQYIPLEDYDPYKINGKFNFKYFDNGMIIEFIEDVYTGYDAFLSLNENIKSTINLYRSKKNILSTGIIDFDVLENINGLTIHYNTVPEIKFKKENNSELFNKNISNVMKHNNFTIHAKEYSLYEDVLFIIEDTIMIIDDIYEVIEKPIKIIPENIPFKKHISLIYSNYDNLAGGAIYHYDKKNKKWIHIKSINKENTKYQNTVNTKIYSGGIFAILNEKIKPNIKNISPAYNSTYVKEDINEISFNATDEESGINYNSIIVKIDNNIQYYEYLPYRDLVRCKLDKTLNKGNHILEILLEDKHYNSSYKKGTFIIE